MRLLLLTVVASAASAQIPAGPAYWNVTGAFVGAAVCASCHSKEAARYRSSSMSRALEPVASVRVLQGNVHFGFQSGRYHYTVAREAEQIIYRVTDGKETFTAPLEYAFGQGKAGQTWVYSVQGQFFESRVSYYAEIKGLDLTVGAMNSAPSDLLSAAGRVMQGSEPRNCFGCHTTGARVGANLQLDRFELGVQCESCHGPGSAHVEALRKGLTAKGTIRSLANMDPQQSNEFCGACHRTWENVMTMGIKGINTARFPAYRLTGSPCFSLDDRRISCTSCHDPHGTLATDDSSYDAKCTACHAGSGPGKTCKVANQSCTSCHMQRVSPAEAHHAFPDHWFRIVRSKDDYPE